MILRKAKYGLIILIFLFMLSSYRLAAQNFKGFVSLGFNVSQIDGDEVYGFKKLGPVVGIGAMMPLNYDLPNEGFQLSMEINYSQRGAKESTSGDPFIYKANLDYLDVPLMLHYVDARGGVTLGLGLQYGRLFHYTESWTLPNPGILGMDRPTITNAEFLKNDFAFVGDFRFTLWQKFKLDVRYQYSLLPIRKDFEFNNSFPASSLNDYRTWLRSFKNNWLTFRIIYVINEEQEQKYTSKSKHRRY
ncbi:MAG: outer membrane beta-barrel protein [Bacteroidales bacterium]|nr:outer membrane beta-barrel protein [Bacteroidales bacterium]